MDKKIKAITSEDIAKADVNYMKGIAAVDKKYTEEVLQSQKKP